ncbi:uncharacterized protein HMPREF1541_02407 [Cyphellophora europaea CBS 101466]|uniref:Calcineurin-like phosphoesterase domain-containing protein n=1 Tax=Cyphellophora europaea (strain CBS 101466) TaxID=1220924 RepID=W2S5B9_CYPE1|nr:uncharacterized protein HMPREF1541_02407 [Cyphellophora europaea CBS 101466]ETN43248.1 hypothetical protein HMPREF1541_02407 [Cyphellophora europaea CBS 101466]
MTDEAGVKTRVLILSDTHCALPGAAHSREVFRWPLPKADVLLHAGDLTMNGKGDQHQRALELIKGCDAELKIVIPGNHDLTLDKPYYHEFGSLHCRGENYSDETLNEFEAMYTGETAQEAGIVYMVEGVRIFTLRSGARFTVYASAYQPEFCNWAFGYSREQDRFNKTLEDTVTLTNAENPVPDAGVDILITHGPPAHILDKTYSGEDVGCVHLRRAVERCKPRLHVFGHIHEAAGAMRKHWFVSNNGEKIIESPGHQEVVDRMSAYYDATDLKHGSESLFINASIMDLLYRPSHNPWLVDLMLPRAIGGGRESAS